MNLEGDCQKANIIKSAQKLNKDRDYKRQIIGQLELLYEIGFTFELIYIGSGSMAILVFTTVIYPSG